MFYGNKYSDLKSANCEYSFVGFLGNFYRLLLGLALRRRRV